MQVIPRGARAQGTGRTARAVTMGLLSVIRKVKSREKEMRMLLIGLDNAGKTTIVKRLAGEDIGEVSPTLGFSIKSLSFRDYRINIWDIGTH